ncbi:MAG: hypothetical protein AAGD05_07440 [Bacteroidota bacterium]
MALTLSNNEEMKESDFMDLSNIVIDRPRKQLFPVYQIEFRFWRFGY